MKWKNWIWALPLTILLLAGCANQVSQADYIGIDKAKEVALQAAGVSASDAAFTTAGLDRKDGTDFYAVDFTVDGQSYEYDVDAVTGVIISSSTGQTGPVPSASGGTSLSDTQTAAGTEGLLTEEEARAAALTHAGLSEQDVTFVKCRLEREDGRQVYDVEFVTADYREYDYEIDPATGEVLSYDYDAESYVSTSGGSEITREEAQRIALEKVPGATAEDIYEFSVDYDDGRLEYEGKIFYDGVEYEFEIDGYSGAIRSWEAEPVSNGKRTTSSSSQSAAETAASVSSAQPTAGTSLLTEEEARAAALTHAGLSEQDVTFVKCRLEREDGRQVYDVEFVTADYREYDYEIDPATGEVLSYDYDAESYVSTSGGSEITREEAQRIALEKVPGATAEDIYEFSVDYDDGRLEYEGKIFYDGVEYEFEIDGYSGAIRSWEAEPTSRR